MSQTIGPVTTQKGPVCFASGFGPVYGPGTQSFVLDLLSAYPAVAFSVRQLTANPLYVRPYCMLVRRDSDNATLNVGYVNGLLDIVSLLAFCGSGNGYVVTWYNQGSLGSSADATQSTAANQPQVCASGVVETQNGVPTVYFGGSQQLNIGSVFSAGTYTSTLSSVFSAGTSTVTYGVYGFPNTTGITIGASRGLLINASGSNKVDIWASNIDVNVSVASVLSLQISRGVFANSGSLIQNYYNGNLIGQNTSAGFNTVPGNGTIGIAYNLGFVGKISEIVYTLSNSASDASIYDLNTASFFAISGVTQ
jgi:hypothetical protein